MLIHLSFNNAVSPRKRIKIHHFRPESNEKEKILIILPAPLCAVAPEDGTGVGPEDRTGVDPACPVKSIRAI